MNRDKPLRSRIRALEEAARAEQRKTRPVLCLKTYDNGETYEGPGGEVYTEEDFARLDRECRLVVIQYVENWREDVSP